LAMPRLSIVILSQLLAVVSASAYPTPVSGAPTRAAQRVEAPMRAAHAPHLWLDSHWAAKGAARSLLYVADGTNVSIYPADAHAEHQNLIGLLTGLDAPWDVAVDANRTLYVLESELNGTVLVFPPGSTKPARQLDCEGAWPVSEAIGANGDVFVSTADQGPLALRVLVYHASSTEPYAILYAPFDGDSSLVSDRKDDLYYIFFPFESIGTVVGFAKATGPGQWDGGVWNLGFGQFDPSSLAFDNSGNIILAQEYGTIGLAVYNPGSRTAQTLIPFPSDTFYVASMTFNRAGDVLYLGTDSGRVKELTYPGGVLLRTIGNLGSSKEPPGLATGIAVSPAATLAPRW
jgi:hypothetical protein